VKLEGSACVICERVRLKDNVGRICFYPTARYFLKRQHW